MTDRYDSSTSAVSEQGGLIAAYVLDAHGGGRAVGWNEIAAWKPDDGVLWVHLDRTGERARRWLAEDSGLERFCIDALLAEDSRPRSVSVRDGLLVNLRGVNLNPAACPEDMVALRLWIERARIVTVRKRRLMAIQDVCDELAQGRGPCSAGDFLAEVCARLVDRMGPVVAAVDDSVDELEDQVLTAESHLLRTELGQLRRQAISLRRYLAPQRDVLLRLQTETVGFLETSHKFRFREIGEQVIRYVEDLDSARERAAVVQEELQNRLAEHMNKTMYTLSLVTTVFLPIGFITGLLGINVGGVPGSEDRHAFAIVTLALLAFVVLQLWFLRHRRLL